MLHIDIAHSAEHYKVAERIFTAYAQFLGLDIEFQGFSQEMASLPSMYGPPKGCLLLAKNEQDYVGGVGLREFEPGVAEMKRLFVLPKYQGCGAGQALVKTFIQQAQHLQYRVIKLDTLRSLDRALVLYKKLGFVETTPYRYNPFPDAVFMERLC